MTTVASPRASRSPALTAASLPKLRLSRTKPTRVSRALACSSSCARAVRAAVVDVDDLESARRRLDRLHEPPVELGQHGFLVAQRHDDAERGAVAHANVQRRLSRKAREQDEHTRRAQTCGTQVMQAEPLRPREHHRGAGDRAECGDGEEARQRPSRVRHRSRNVKRRLPA